MRKKSKHEFLFFELSSSWSVKFIKECAFVTYSGLMEEICYHKWGHKIRTRGTFSKKFIKVRPPKEVKKSGIIVLCKSRLIKIFSNCLFSMIIQFLIDN